MFVRKVLNALCTASAAFIASNDLRIAGNELSRPAASSCPILKETIAAFLLQRN
jgi:hypothetical protein